MTEHERKSFNQALDKVRKYKWEKEFTRQLEHKFSTLDLDDTIKLIHRMREVI